MQTHTHTQTHTKQELLRLRHIYIYIYIYMYMHTYANAHTHTHTHTHTHNRNYCGSGLGLSVVRSLVEAFGGVISLKSSVDEKDHGTTFTVKLPLEDPRNSSSEEKKDAALDDTEALTGAPIFQNLLFSRVGSGSGKSIEAKKKKDMLLLHKSEVCMCTGSRF
jgi:hypothetical protein